MQREEYADIVFDRFHIDENEEAILKVQDLEVERSRVSYGGVHNFGVLRNHRLLQKAKLFRGSPSVSHVFGFSTALKIIILYKKNQNSCSR